MKKSAFVSVFTVALSLVGIGFYLFTFNSSSSWLKPIDANYEHEEENDEEEFKKKTEPWSVENALRHQKLLAKTRALINKANRALGDEETFGALKGAWYNKAPMNMPGAFKFAEMLDGTDTIYGVTHNHYSGEFNSKSYIFKGTVYNPKTGNKGDDFVRLTGHWPNRYSNLIVHKFNGKTRLIAGIENGPVYYSDNDGKDWTKSSGLPSVIKSTIINRQDERVYATDGGSVYVSTDGAISFSLLQGINSVGDAALYSPRYDVQQDADKVYFAREGSFYELNSAKTSFTLKGAYSGSHNNSAFSIGGDSRKLYVTVNKDYWVSTNGGVTWTQKYPSGNWYGDRTGDMDAGKFLAASPEDPNYVMGGYAQPVFSTDGLDTDNSTDGGWGYYQGGTSLGLSDYRNRIRFNYHPDIQASHFFYNASGDLFSVMCTDGGMFMSYKAWYDHPCTTCGPYTNTDYANAHFININTLNTPCALIYRHNMFTGYKDPNHLIYSTQDQGTAQYIKNTGGDTLNVYQGIGGDGPPLYSADGNWVWKWKRQGSEVWMPYELYDGSGNMRSIYSVSSGAGNQASVTFTEDTRVGWVQAFIDKDEPSKRIWMLNKSLCRAEVSGSSITGTTISKGTGHQVCAFTQAVETPDIVFFLQEGKVYKSINRGDSFDGGTSTPFSKTSNNQNIGGGWVLPGNDNWVMFAGPSGNGVGAILSKDGGSTWADVTGDFPSGDDFQVGAMVGTPDGEYLFAGTDLGPYVFVVAEEKWYPMFGGEAGMFNAMGVEYIESIKTVRFASWGSGVWDFVINDNVPKITFDDVASEFNNCDSLKITWSAMNISGSGTIELLKNSVLVDSWSLADVTKGLFSYFIPNSLAQGDDYQIKVTGGVVSSTSNAFTIAPQLQVFSSSNLTVDYVDSEHNSSRLATNTIDGDNATFWHTEWSPGTPGFPHEIIYQSNSSEEFVAFSYLPRQDGSSNGRVANFEIYGSNDGKSSWTLLKSGTLVNQSGIQTVRFNEKMDCDYVKFTMLSEQTGAFYASMGEFGLYTAISCAEDCNGDIGGTAFLDSCGVCAGGNTGNDPELDPEMCVITSANNQFKNGAIYPTILNVGSPIYLPEINGKVKVFRVNGQLVFEGNIRDNKILTTHSWGTGIYFVQIDSENQSFSQKVVLQK